MVDFRSTMVDARAVITSWFITLKQDTYVLIRIESLVALVTVVFLAMFTMDIFRCRSGNSTITTIIKIADGVSDQIVVYLIGAMQSADFKNQLFPVWAIVLVSLRASLGYLSGYSIMDRERRITELSNVIKFVGAGVLNGTRALKFTKPLWSLWAILTLRSIYKFVAHGWAIESLWHGRSSEFLPENLRKGHNEPQDQNNHTDNMERYLVYGESNQEIDIDKPGYTLYLNVTNRDSLITLHKIHNNHEGLLAGTDNRYKEMSLAFTLSRLLRCRLEDVPLHPKSTNTTRDIVVSEIINNTKEEQSNLERTEREKARRAFRILELELAFIRDYFYTLYPMVFGKGLFSLSLSLLLSMATFGVAFWLAVGIRKAYKPDKDNFVIWVNGWNVDVAITWVFMSFMMFKEIWEMVTYLLSNWTRLLLVCKYVQSKQWCCPTNNCLMEGLIWLLYKLRLAKPWHGCIKQFEFLHSYNYKPRFWKLAHFVTLGKTPEKFDGKKTGDAIKVPDSVKTEIIKKIYNLMRIDVTLQRVSGSRFTRYERASLKMYTCAQVILVWHIATSICENKLRQNKKIDLSEPGFLSRMWSCLKKMACCCSQQSGDVPRDELLNNFEIANSLSRYCAYLVVFQSELLPDSFTVPEAMFDTTIKQARMKMEERIMQEAEQEGEAGYVSILQQGARLANELIGNGEDYRKCWETLADVWTDLIVDIAPSWNTEAHKQNIESGGEFITLIWALLWHCDIEKNSLERSDNASGNHSPAPPEITEDRAETTNAQLDGEETVDDEAMDSEGVDPSS